MKTDTTSNHKFVSAAQLAATFEVSVRTIRRWQQEGVLRGYKLGGGRAVRFRMDEVERAILGKHIAREGR